MIATDYRAEQQGLTLSKAAMPTTSMLQLQAERHDMLQLQGDMLQLKDEGVIMKRSAHPVSPTWRGQRWLRSLHDITMKHSGIFGPTIFNRLTFKEFWDPFTSLVFIRTVKL